MTKEKFFHEETKPYLTELLLLLSQAAHTGKCTYDSQVEYKSVFFSSIIVKVIFL
jgi:hypothetical protein